MCAVRILEHGDAWVCSFQQYQYSNPQWMVVLLFLDANKRYIVLILDYKVMRRVVKADLTELVCTILENLASSSGGSVG